jgi:hypothetical protein
MSAWRSWRPDHAIRAQSTWTWVAIALLVGGLALPGCQEMGDDRATASSELAPVAEAPVEAGYPLLQSVPPRPQLSYTVQQQRQIVEALIADRENARYTSKVVRHRSGLSSLPPPPTPPAPAAPITVEPAVAARDRPAPERRPVEQETFVDFLNALLFDEPAGAPVAEPAPDLSSEPEERNSAAPEALPDVPGGDEPAPASIARAIDPPSDAPLPPARSAVAARLAAGPDLIDALVDETMAQMPLPPGQSALAARLAVAERIDAPLPAPRPAMARSADAALPASLPAPPPLKPIVPVSTPMPPRPAEKPADHRSAAAHDPRELLETAAMHRSARAVLIVANAAV